MSELIHESVFIAVKDALQRNGIKLWVSPYYLESASDETEMMNLARNFSESLNIKYEYCFAALSELQNHAIDKLQSNKELKEHGLATLKIRIPHKKSFGGSIKFLNIKINLNESVGNLMTLISTELQNLNSNSIKLISSGRLLDQQKSLAEQNVKNFQQILAIQVNEVSENEDKNYSRITKIRRDAETLLMKNSSDYFKLENQNGEAIHLPKVERVSIIMALLLYEKGRTELKKENYADALIFFLEADNEIQNCNSPIIKSIDNVGLLNLDITWCYLQLQSITQLPDGERRLMICEDNFKRSYGENFERLKCLKNYEMSERCLVLRLKILKGILYFHQNRRQESLLYLNMAEMELKQLKVDDDKIETLLEMGYNYNESVIALRNTFNTTIDAAVNFIQERRSKLENARKIGRKERKIAQDMSLIGFDDVNPRSISTLYDMGFNKELSALALQKTAGNITASIIMLQNNSENLKKELADTIKPNSELIHKLKVFGFDETLATSILKNNFNDFDKALDVLLEMQKNGQIAIEFQGEIEKAINVGASTSFDKTSNIQISSNNPHLEEEETIFKKLKSDLDHLEEDDEYLNIGNLHKEEKLITQYKRALGEK